MLIEVVGNVASGKTTLAKKLSKKLRGKYIDVDLFINNPFLTRAAQDRKRWAFTTGVCFLLQRIKEYQKIKKNKKVIVIDQGIDMGVFVYSKTAYMQKMMLAKEYELLINLHNQLTINLEKPDLIIYLKASLDTIKKRITSRGRKHETYYSDDYLLGLQKNMSSFVLNLKKQKQNVIQFDVDRKKISFNNPRIISKNNQLIKFLKNYAYN